MKGLNAILRDYTATSNRDARAQSELQRLLMVPEIELARRDNYQPGHLTSSAFITNPERTHILANYHGKCLAWMHFGGHWENRADTAFETVVQEICQEVFNHPSDDLRPPYRQYGFVSLLGGAPFDMSDGVVDRSDEPKHSHYDLRFLFELPMSAPVLKSTESRDIAWMTYSDALDCWTKDSEIDSYRALEKLAKAMR